MQNMNNIKKHNKVKLECHYHFYVINYKKMVLFCFILFYFVLFCFIFQANEFAMFLFWSTSRVMSVPNTRFAPMRVT